MSDIITTLHPENDETTNLYPNIKKDNIPNMSIDLDKLSPDVRSILEGASSLEPTGADTTANIQAKTSNDGIWISTNNGHWFYWNGSQYVDSGMAYMQTVIPNKVLMNLALYIPKLTIDKANKTITIDTTSGIIISKFSYVGVASISVRTISYDGLNDGIYYLYIRNNTLYFANISVDCQQTDIIISIVYIVSGSVYKLGQD